MAGDLFLTRHHIYKAVEHYTQDEDIRTRLRCLLRNCTWVRAQKSTFVSWLKSCREPEFAAYVHEIQ